MQKGKHCIDCLQVSYNVQIVKKKNLSCLSNASAIIKLS